MAKFRLLAGQHIAADKSKPINDAEGKPTGRFEKQTFKVGDLVESDTDLVKKHGPEKFELVSGEVQGKDDEIAKLQREIDKLRSEKAALVAGGFRTPGDPTPENLLKNPSVAPGGQVSTGFQGGPPKGEDIDNDGGPPDDSYGDLESMTVHELRELAATEEIDLGSATRKDQIIAAIRQAK